MERKSAVLEATSEGAERLSDHTLPLEKVMTKEKTQGDELSAIGKQTMAHAYSAMDYYFDHLKKTVASAPSGGTEFGETVKACAEHNITATQKFLTDLSYAKDIQDMLRIQMEFMRSQLEAFGEQAKDLGEAYMTNALAAGHAGGHMGSRFGEPLIGSAPMTSPIYNPSTPYTVTQPPEVGVSPASPGSVFH
jgi:hypothetical protein